MTRVRPRTGSLYDQGEWVDVGGLETWVVRAGPRAGTPVVLLHGIPTSAYLYRNVMRGLMEDADCLAFDWPGFGSSAKPRKGDYTHQAREAHLEGLLDAVGIDKLDLVVHDVGGPAGLLFAVRHPERVRRLVILNTTVYRRDYKPPLPAVAQFVPGIRALSRPFFNRPMAEYFMKKGLAHPERLSAPVLDVYWKLLRQGDGIGPVLDTWAQFPQGAGAVREIREKMGAFPNPVLVLFGAEDPYLPPANAERLAKDFPHARLELLKDAGHFLQEDAPDVVADRLRDFLARDGA